VIYPRSFWNRFLRRCRSAVSDSLAITPAPPVTFVFSCRRRSVALLGLPARPSPRRAPAFVTATALSRPLRTKLPLTSLQQSASRPRPPARRLAGFPVFGRECRILVRAHGSCGSRKLKPWRGLHSPLGRSRFRFSADSRVYRRATLRRPVRLVFSRLASAVVGSHHVKGCGHLRCHQPVAPWTLLALP
jgi:hypothetical protein